MRRLKQLIGWTIWGLIGLYVAAILWLRLPSAQAWVGKEVAAALSQTLQTKVSVGRVNVGLGGRVVIDSVTIDDQSRRQLLNVGRLSCKIDLLPLWQGRISIASAGLFGAHAWLRKDAAEGPTNFQFIIDRLSSKDTTSTSALDLHIGSFIMRRSSISWQEDYLAPTPGRFNAHHLNVSGISAHVVVRTLTPDTLNVHLKRLAFSEQSGLSIKRLSARVTAGKKGFSVSDLALALPHSHLAVSPFTISPKKELSPCELRGAVSPCDVSAFFPILKNYEDPITVEATGGGGPHHIYINGVRISGDPLHISGEGWLKGKSWQAHIRQMSVGKELTERLTTELHLPEALKNLGNLHLTAQVRGEATTSITIKGSLTTDAGQAQADFQLRDGKNMRLQVSTPALQAGQLAAIADLGEVAGKISVNGTLHNFEAEATMSRIVFKGYTYQQISATAEVRSSQKSYQCALEINDPNLSANLTGQWQQARLSTLQINGQVSHISPHALHLTKRWPGASFQGDIQANFTASRLGDAVGETHLTQFAMTDSTGVYAIDGIHVKSGYNQGRHYLKMDSDFGAVELDGPFDWATLPQSVTAYLANHLPSLPGLPKEIKATHNQFRLNAQITDSRPLQKLLNIPLDLHQPVTLYMAINDSAKRIDLHATAPSFTLGGNRYQGAVVSLTSPADTMLLRLSADKMGSHTTHLQISAAAAADHLQSSIEWDNHDPKRALRGELNADMKVYENELGKGEAHIELRPSLMTVGDGLWTISSSDIIYSDHRVEAHNVAARHDQQYLTIDGVASANPNDTLTVGLGDIDLSYVLGLVGFHSVEFAGQASGKAYVAGAFKNPEAWADLTIHHFTFEQGRMGTLFAQAQWNNHDQQIDIHATANDGPDALTLINGYVSPTRNYIDLDIGARGTYIDFMHSFTDNFLSSITGHADGDLRLAGPLSTMNLTGKLVVKGQAAVTALGTTYTLQGDTVTFIPDDILLDKMRVTDRNNHTAILSGGIHHKHLTKLTFDLDVEAKNFLAYHFPRFDDSNICGTVYATGQVDLHGRPGETIINCNVTPEAHSTFSYNAAAADAVSSQEFITFRQAGQDDNQNGGDSLNAPKETHEVPSDLRINFVVNATPAATVRVLMDATSEDYITLHGNGTINASYYNKGPFQMFGTYTVTDGTYGITIQNILRKNFTFQQGGTLQFGGDPFEAALNLKAVYTVNGVSLSDLNIGNSFSKNTIRVNCLMNILGQAGAPRVEFDLEMPTVNAEEAQMIRSIIASGQETNQQVVYLLGVGRFYNPTATTQAGQYGQTQLAMQSLLSGTVSSQINEVLSQVIKNDNWNFGANISTGDEGWHNAEYEGIINGRMLNNRLLINGQFGYRDNAAQANTSFIGDFDIRYLLTPNGNLALKVYNQTNDRYFTRSSLNTQGIGLIMKKDFNSVSDFFGIKRKNKKQK